MPTSVMISPRGRLSITQSQDGYDLPPDVSGGVVSAFAESSSEGLLHVATLECELPPDLVYWRQFSQGLFQQLCHLGEAPISEWSKLQPPASEEFERSVADAPPMRGLEYLGPDVLLQLWNELRDLVVSRARAHAEGPAHWLRSVHSLWHLLGRVTFHLAENKRDERRPFAFLATFTHRLSNQSRLQHLPMAEALKTYAGAKDTTKLHALLEPVRRAAEESPLVRDLLDTKAIFAPQAWTIGQAYRYLQEAPKIERAGVVVRLPNWWSARNPPRPQVQVHLGNRPVSYVGMDHLLDFNVNLALDGEPLTAEEQRQLLGATEGLVLLRGKWVEADKGQIEQAIEHWQRLKDAHASGIGFLEGMRLLAGAKIDEERDKGGAIADWSNVTAGTWLKQTLERLRRPESIEDCRPGQDLRATLRPYQTEGVRWLWFVTELGLGGCLADDMGLGKTIQMIDLMLLRKKQKPDQPPTLLIVPASLIGNWRQELARFGPTLRFLIAHRAETPSETLDRVAKDPETSLKGVDVVLTTYGLARRQEWLSKLRWPLIVLDEAQAIKNAGSTQTKTIKKLKAGCRLVMTGTPVENHLGDLWSLFDFCCPGLLGSASAFKKYVKELDRRQDANAYGALRRLVRPYILRRLKTDPNIVPDLPDKTEMRTECVLSKKQATLYQRAVHEFTARLKQSDGIKRRGLVLAMLMHLKQICNHPAQYLPGGVFEPAESGKFERLALLCEPIAERQEKALIFTQFQTLTDPLAEYLAGVFGRPGLVLHGATPVKKRSDLVRAFQEDGGPPFFVISVKAGGSGLNLTAASHVIHFDRWWNPAVENQATDRAFRIGQKRNVLVHKFVCRGTVEERIDEMIAAKQEVADQILNEEGETKLTELSDDELLRFVALDIKRATSEE